MKKLGPVLQFLACTQNTWRVSALVVVGAKDPAPQLTVTAPQVNVSRQQGSVLGRPDCSAWRFEWGIAQTTADQVVSYHVDGKTYQFVVPARGASPAMAYASCNGFSSLSLMKKVAVPNALWARLVRLHTQQDRVDTQTYGPFHLLVLGGDQIYSDAMWDAVPELKAWSSKEGAQRLKAPFSARMRKQLQTYFAKMYLERWSQADVAAATASVPAVMMWDDHDIMDGWGSYPADMHNCPVYQGIYQVAQAAFALFQRHMLGTPDSVPPATLPGQSAYNSAYRIGDVGLLALDMRSERRPRSGDVTATGGVLNVEQVMSAQSWTAVFDWLSAQEAAATMKHLFIMSSIPVLHPSFELLEKLLGVFPGQQELEDDLRDHWTSPPHKAERLRLIHRLLQASAGGIRVTVLSGDVHVAAVGVIESNRSDLSANARVINQLTSSGIVHPQPPGVALFFLEQACKTVEQIDRGISGTMYEFPTTSHRMIGQRNFLSLQADRPGQGSRYWANWWVEGEPHPYTKVIHSISAPRI